MQSIIGSFFSNTSDQSADKTIAYSAASGAAAAAQGYTSATLASTTPEVRRLFGEYATQSLMGHQALVGLMVQRGWINPYDEPTQQLQAVLKQSEPSVNNVQ